MTDIVRVLKNTGGVAPTNKENREQFIHIQQSR